jgi:hypothetical protein
MERKMAHFMKKKETAWISMFILDAGSGKKYGNGF